MALRSHWLWLVCKGHLQSICSLNAQTTAIEYSHVCQEWPEVLWGSETMRAGRRPVCHVSSQWDWEDLLCLVSSICPNHVKSAWCKVHLSCIYSNTFYALLLSLRSANMWLWGVAVNLELSPCTTMHKEETTLEHLLCSKSGGAELCLWRNNFGLLCADIEKKREMVQV